MSLLATKIGAKIFFIIILVLVLSRTGGMGKLATTFYKRLASMISEKKIEITSYSQVRGSRSSYQRPRHDCVEQRFLEAR